jgi:transcriptional regulator with PAS, ATPase and Fis domain
MMLHPLSLCVANSHAVRDAVFRLCDRIDTARLEMCARPDKAMFRLGRIDLRLVFLQPAADTLSAAERMLLDTAPAFTPNIGLLGTPSQVACWAAQYPHLSTFALPGDEFRLRQFIEEAHAHHFRGDDAGDAFSQDNPTATFLGSEWADLMKRIRRVARQDTTVLLTGETGCGKTLLARRLHDESARADRPFVVADCAAMSETHVASDLFGHVRGAFTGADRERTGKLAEARNGTLVLDEINSLPLSLQAKLLRAVDERVFEPLGSNAPQRFEGRIVAATNADLEEEVRQGRFRPDLFFRLNVMEFRIPPLRERVGAIIPLAQQFIRDSRVAAEHGVTSLTPAALQALLRYPWPGNVRELRNAIERAATVAGTAAIDVDDLPPIIAATEQPVRPPVGLRPDPFAAVRVDPPSPPVAPVGEKERIAAVLRQHNNNRLAAAKELGISRNSLYKKMHRLGIFLPKWTDGEPMTEALAESC